MQRSSTGAAGRASCTTVAHSWFVNRSPTCIERTQRDTVLRFRLCVRPSATLWYCVYTIAHIGKLSVRSAESIALVFDFQRRYKI